MEELEVDCKHVFSYICADSVFDGLIGTEVPVVDAVSEAFCMLNTPDSEQCSLKQGMSPYACMVVSILVQWLVRYLCKRLMQVMTPEALTIHRGKIASTYIHNYLQFQIHFSLKKLITTSYRTLQIDGERLVSCIYNLLTFLAPKYNLSSMHANIIFSVGSNQCPSCVNLQMC